MQPGYQQPIVQQSNLNVERQFGNFSLSVGWQMVKANHLQRTRDINLGTPVPTVYTIAGTGETVTFEKYPSPRPIAEFRRISQFESSANSLYHGMFVQLKKRMSHNFQGMLSYTWSHAIDDVPDATAVVPGSSDDAKMLFDPKCGRCDRSNGLADQRHRLVISGVWQLNYANGLSFADRAILGGWELSTIFTAQSGQPYFGLVSGDPNGDSNSFTDRLPTFSRGAFYLPSQWSLDPRLTKRFALTERANMQLFLEAFNVTNRFNVYAVKNTQYAASGTTLTPPTGLNAFGTPTSPGGGSNYPYAGPVPLDGARVFQVGAKINF
jgi:hypothetical protein